MSEMMQQQFDSGEHAIEADTRQAGEWRSGVAFFRRDGTTIKVGEPLINENPTWKRCFYWESSSIRDPIPVGTEIQAEG